jgi:hypothetical protein
MSSQDPRAQLTEELISKTSAAVVTAVGAALGVNVTSPSDATRTAAELPTVDGFFISYGTEILAVYALSSGRLIRYELSRDGRYLSVCIPLSRVARIAETNENERLSVLVELDADRRSLTVTGSLTTAAGTGVEGAGQRLNAEAVMLSSAFMLEVPASDAARLAAFAQQLRRALI